MGKGTIPVIELFEQKPLVKVCAPMVRYSKLPFRLLVREYDCDLTFSPMLMADSFTKSEKARIAEFSTNEDDTPLIVQFASNTPEEFAGAAELIYHQSQGIDLNCGCPQTWARQERIGACLMREPEVLHDVLRQTRNRICDNDFSVSIKIRVFDDLKKTVDLARQLEATGISFLTVHGRTIKERKEPVKYDYIQAICDSLSIPVIANGDIKTLEDCYRIQEMTGCKGVMAATGILQNPTLFTGTEITPISCLKRWLQITENLDDAFHIYLFHHHCAQMIYKLLRKKERGEFNLMQRKERSEMIEYLTTKFEGLSDYNLNLNIENTLELEK